MSTLFERIPQSKREQHEHVEAWGFDVLVVAPSFGVIEKLGAVGSGLWQDVGMMSEVVADAVLDPDTRKPVFESAKQVRGLRTDPNPVIKLGNVALELANLSGEAVAEEKKD